MTLDTHRSTLLVIDIQSKLAPAIAESEVVIKECEDIIQVAQLLEVETIYTEQYPKGLGATVPELKSLLETTAIRLEKLSFSCMGERRCHAKIRDLLKPQVVVCGMETHVCVLQTVLDLIEEGYEVFVIEEAVSSRTLKNKQLALARMEAAGAQIISKEMAIFEWLGSAEHPRFKEISKNFIR